MLSYLTPPVGGGIYQIRLSDKHYYGGRAVCFRSRFRRHLRHLKKGDHPNKHMQNVFNKYGHFEPEIIAQCPPTEQDRIEQEWLDEHYGKTGCLNMNPYSHGGNGPHTEELKKRMTGRKLSAAHIESLEQAQRRRFGNMSEEDRRKMLEIRRNAAEKRRGVPMSDEAKANMSKAQKGRVITDSHREKLRAAWARRKASGAETRCLPKKENPPNTDEIVAFVKAGGSIRGANKRFFGDGRDHRSLIRRLVAEYEN